MLLDSNFWAFEIIGSGTGVCALSTYVVMRTCGYQYGANNYEPFTFAFEAPENKDLVVVQLD